MEARTTKWNSCRLAVHRDSGRVRWCVGHENAWKSSLKKLTLFPLFLLTVVLLCVFVSRVLFNKGQVNSADGDSELKTAPGEVLVFDGGETLGDSERLGFGGGSEGSFLVEEKQERRGKSENERKPEGVSHSKNIPLSGSEILKVVKNGVYKRKKRESKRLNSNKNENQDRISQLKKFVSNFSYSRQKREIAVPETRETESNLTALEKAFRNLVIEWKNISSPLNRDQDQQIFNNTKYKIQNSNQENNFAQNGINNSRIRDGIEQQNYSTSLGETVSDSNESQIINQEEEKRQNINEELQEKKKHQIINDEGETEEKSYKINRKLQEDGRNKNTNREIQIEKNNQLQREESNRELQEGEINQEIQVGKSSRQLQEEENNRRVQKVKNNQKLHIEKNSQELQVEENNQEVQEEKGNRENHEEKNNQELQEEENNGQNETQERQLEEFGKDQNISHENRNEETPRNVNRKLQGEENQNTNREFQEEKNNRQLQREENSRGFLGEDINRRLREEEENSRKFHEEGNNQQTEILEKNRQVDEDEKHENVNQERQNEEKLHVYRTFQGEDGNQNYNQKFQEEKINREHQEERDNRAFQEEKNNRKQGEKNLRNLNHKHDFPTAIYNNSGVENDLINAKRNSGALNETLSGINRRNSSDLDERDFNNKKSSTLRNLDEANIVFWGVKSTIGDLNKSIANNSHTGIINNSGLSSNNAIANDTNQSTSFKFSGNAVAEESSNTLKGNSVTTQEYSTIFNGNFVTTEESSNKIDWNPVTKQSSNTGNPFTEESSNTRNLVSEESSNSGNPVSEESSTKGNHVSEESSNTGSHVTEESTNTGNSVTEESSSTGNPVTEEFSNSGNPVTEESTNSENPVTEESSNKINWNPITEESSNKFKGNSVAETPVSGFISSTEESSKIDPMKKAGANQNSSQNKNSNKGVFNNLNAFHNNSGFRSNNAISNDTNHSTSYDFNGNPVTEGSSNKFGGKLVTEKPTNTFNGNSATEQSSNKINPVTEDTSNKFIGNPVTEETSNTFNRNPITEEMFNKFHGNPVTDDSSNKFSGNPANANSGFNSSTEETSNEKSGVNNQNPLDRTSESNNSNGNSMAHMNFWKNKHDSEEIRRTQAENMLKYMDTTTNPCEDFYQYACGNWHVYNPIPPDRSSFDTFEMLRESLDSVLRDLLEEDVPDDPVRIDTRFLMVEPESLSRFSGHFESGDSSEKFSENSATEDSSNKFTGNRLTEEALNTFTEESSTIFSGNHAIEESSNKFSGNPFTEENFNKLTANFVTEESSNKFTGNFIHEKSPKNINKKSKTEQFSIKYTRNPKIEEVSNKFNGNSATKSSNTFSGNPAIEESSNKFSGNSFTEESFNKFTGNFVTEESSNKFTGNSAPEKSPKNFNKKTKIEQFSIKFTRNLAIEEASNNFNGNSETEESSKIFNGNHAIEEFSNKFSGNSFTEESFDKFTGNFITEESSNKFTGNSPTEESSYTFSGNPAIEESSNTFSGNSFTDESVNKFTGNFVTEESSNKFTGNSPTKKSSNTYIRTLANEEPLSKSIDFSITKESSNTFVGNYVTKRASNKFAEKSVTDKSTTKFRRNPKNEKRSKKFNRNSVTEESSKKGKSKVKRKYLVQDSKKHDSRFLIVELEDVEKWDISRKNLEEDLTKLDLQYLIGEPEYFESTKKDAGKSLVDDSINRVQNNWQFSIVKPKYVRKRKKDFGWKNRVRNPTKLDLQLFIEEPENIGKRMKGVGWMNRVRNSTKLYFQLLKVEPKYAGRNKKDVGRRNHDQDSINLDLQFLMVEPDDIERKNDFGKRNFVRNLTKLDFQFLMVEPDDSENKKEDFGKENHDGNLTTIKEQEHFERTNKIRVGDSAKMIFLNAGLKKDDPHKNNLDWRLSVEDNISEKQKVVSLKVKRNLNKKLFERRKNDVRDSSELNQHFFNNGFRKVDPVINNLNSGSIEEEQETNILAREKMDDSLKFKQNLISIGRINNVSRKTEENIKLGNSRKDKEIVTKIVSTGRKSKIFLDKANKNPTRKERIVSTAKSFSLEKKSRDFTTFRNPSSIPRNLGIDHLFSSDATFLPVDFKDGESAFADSGFSTEEENISDRFLFGSNFYKNPSKRPTVVSDSTRKLNKVEKSVGFTFRSEETADFGGSISEGNQESSRSTGNSEGIPLSTGCLKEVSNPSGILKETTDSREILEENIDSIEILEKITYSRGSLENLTGISKETPISLRYSNKTLDSTESRIFSNTTKKYSLTIPKKSGILSFTVDNHSSKSNNTKRIKFCTPENFRNPMRNEKGIECNATKNVKCLYGSIELERGKVKCVIKENGDVEFFSGNCDFGNGGELDFVSRVNKRGVECEIERVVEFLSKNVCCEKKSEEGVFYFEYKKGVECSTEDVKSEIRNVKSTSEAGEVKLIFDSEEVESISETGDVESISETENLKAISEAGDMKSIFETKDVESISEAESCENSLKNLINRDNPRFSLERTNNLLLNAKTFEDKCVIGNDVWDYNYRNFNCERKGENECVTENMKSISEGGSCESPLINKKNNSNVLLDRSENFQRILESIKEVNSKFLSKKNKNFSRILEDFMKVYSNFLPYKNSNSAKILEGFKKIVLNVLANKNDNIPRILESFKKIDSDFLTKKANSKRTLKSFKEVDSNFLPNTYKNNKIDHFSRILVDLKKVDSNFLTNKNANSTRILENFKEVDSNIIPNKIENSMKILEDYKKINSNFLPKKNVNSVMFSEGFKKADSNFLPSKNMHSMRTLKGVYSSNSKIINSAYPKKMQGEEKLRKKRYTHDDSYKALFAKLKPTPRPFYQYILNHSYPQPKDAITKAKYLFRSCMNEDLIKTRGVAPLLHLLEELGGWPVLDDNWDRARFDFEWVLGQLRLYNNDILISEWVGPDIRNSEEYVIQIDQSTLGLPSRDYFLDKANRKYVDAYKRFIETVAVLLGGDQELASEDAEDIIDFEIELAAITVSAEHRKNVSDIYVRLKLAELHSIIPQIDWFKYVRIITRKKPAPNDPIVTFSLNYLHRLVGLLSTSNPRTVCNYLLWRFIRHRVNNLDDRFQDAKQRFYKVLFGREQSPQRWQSCISQVNSNLGMALGSLFVQKYFDERSKNDTLEMTMRLRESFKELLLETDWLDIDTKKSAALKIDYMRLKIGYPNYILDEAQLNKRYKDVQVHPSFYFENTLSILQHLTRLEHSKLNFQVDKNFWNSPPAVVNAYYSRNKNQIMFPAGILQPPFYHRNFPRSLNYGGIGVVIGHEMTHGFDDKGRLFDKDGNLKVWWKKESIEEFHERSKCLIEQYNAYIVPEANIQMDGSNTQGENIADNGGIKQAFRAYKHFLSKNPTEETLPGINLTNLQLFFLNFAQIWCGTTRPEAARNKLRTAVHSPGRFRVIGTLSNSEEFSKVYHCPAESPMNPKVKCKIW